MKNIFVCLLFINCISVCAQTPRDSAYLQITYLEDYVKTTENPKKKIPDEMILNLGRFGSEFYSNYNNRRSQIKDSLSSKGGKLSDYVTLVGDMPKGQNYRIYKNMPAKGLLSNFDKVGIDNYIYQEPLQIPVWDLVPESKVVNGYTCQKAKTNFKGREWTAWYTTEIPISDGPWKLCGLPGLILDATDSDNYFHFFCIRVKKIIRKEPLKIVKANMQRCSKEEFIRLAKEFCENANLYLTKKSNVNFVIYDTDGKPTKCPSLKFFDMEKDE